MNLIRWQPLWSRDYMPGFAVLQRGMNRFFEDFADEGEEKSVIQWSPRVDITELEDRFEIASELPGMKKDDVKVELKENILTISGEKSGQNEKKDRNLHVCERVYGSFSRSFRLPPHVKSEDIKAEFKDGVLNLEIPKSEEAKPKQIEVKIK